MADFHKWDSGTLITFCVEATQKMQVQDEEITRLREEAKQHEADVRMLLISHRRAVADLHYAKGTPTS